ncbi:MAG: T9SS type A sorting domain-containing protein [Ignavibacteriales bacterium]|nr:T9SS type A sorting domain-containing protein [Ignavibacteriales bacterium]
MKLILIFFYIISSLMYSQNIWQWQNPIPQGNYLTDICFVDSLNGFACGYLGTILKTTNGGQEWINIETDIEDLFIELSFIDKQNGWVMDYYKSNLYRTTDFGESWQHLGQITDSYMYSFEMVTDSVGYACGSDSKFFMTMDGGKTWSKCDIPLYMFLHSLDFVNDNIGYLVGDKYYFLETKDGGKNWQYAFLPVYPYNFGAWFVEFKDTNFGYISGYELENGIILLTKNGGASWKRIILGSSIDKVFFNNDSTGWAKDISKKLYFTSDGGVNWQELGSGFLDIFFLNQNKSWAINSLNNICFSNDGWQTSNNQINSVTSKSLYDIEIKDSNNIFVCGNNVVLGTTNGGSVWKSLHVNSEKVFNAVKIKNENEIWAVSNKGFITFSYNKGDTWNDVKLSATWLNDIYFLNSYTGFVVGNNSNTGKIFRTENGGQSWDTLQNTPNVEYFERIIFVNDTLGWLSSNNGIYKSSDGGLNWVLIKSGFLRTLEAFDNSVWTSSINKIHFSTDGGVTWNNSEVYKIIGGVIRSISSISFINESIGWVVVDDGRIFKTYDGGFKWSVEERLSGIALHGIKFLDESKGWSVGDGGTILYYGNFTNNIENSTYIYSPFLYNLSQNYPNPFNPTTNIQFEIPLDCKVTIKIYNILGQEIATLINNEMKAGKHTVQFSANNLANGVYIYRITADSFSKSMKMMILK